MHVLHARQSVYYGWVHMTRRAENFQFPGFEQRNHAISMLRNPYMYLIREDEQ